ncbi:MAG: hypothetical protein HOM58_08860 [Rhodospirillaceae bacterium]|jgi:hypothetical protein|nr:hypothetical protein [Rhodospirillaceae bacterium]
MPGPSADDRVAAAKPADRWSLAVSSLLILGLFLATAAMVQNWRTTPPNAKPVAPTPKPKAAMPDPTGQALAIRLPLPPPPAARPATPVLQPAPTPPQPLAKPRIIVPLKRPDETARPRPKPSPVKPLKVTPLKPVTPAPVAKPAPPAPKKVIVKKPTPEPIQAGPVIDAVQHRKTGGALLRLLEHGKGPSVEIAWPQSAASRQRLYRTLTRCYGMRPALLTKDARLFDKTTAPGQHWAINRDRYSGFIRSPQGEPIREENRQFATIARRHDLIDWRPVRVFPRSVDSVLLGGLETLLGERYQRARQIRAAYRLQRTGLSLTGFQVDGQAIGGVVTLQAGPGCD